MFVEPLGSIGAVTGVPVDVFRSVPESRAMLLEAMQEIQRISKALGIRLRPEASEISRARLDALPAGSATSMHPAIVEGRPWELVEQPVRWGRFPPGKGSSGPSRAPPPWTRRGREIQDAKAGPE